MARKQGILLREAEIVSDFFCESSRRTRRGDLGSGGLVGLRLGLSDPEALPAQVPALCRNLGMGCGLLLRD
jgi:hypothetical protein